MTADEFNAQLPALTNSQCARVATLLGLCSRQEGES